MYGPLVVASLLVGLMMIAVQLWPAEYWIRVDPVHIENGRESAKLKVITTRHIKHNFYGSSTANVLHWESDGWVYVCGSTSRLGMFGEDTKLPSDLTLSKWTFGSCHPLPVGEYMVTKTWTIILLGIIPDKVYSASSNVFTVLP